MLSHLHCQGWKPVSLISQLPLPASFFQWETLELDSGRKKEELSPMVVAASGAAEVVIVGAVRF